MKKVLIALDYNPTAQKVAEIGYSLVKGADVEVTLMHVMGNPVFYTSTVYEPIMGFGGYIDNDFLYRTFDKTFVNNLHFYDTTEKCNFVIVKDYKGAPANAPNFILISNLMTSQEFWKNNEKCTYQFNINEYYLYCGIMLFAKSTICFNPSSGKFPFLNSANTFGSLLVISNKKCASNSFTLRTDTSLNKPFVPK